MQKKRKKKALGQHFLTDMSIAERIASTLDGYRGTPVLEVGPGMGVLTQFLIDAGHTVKVAEIDGESIEWLKANFPGLPQENILNCDFLKLDLSGVFSGDLFQDIPYRPPRVLTRSFPPPICHIYQT